jgi:hypothetical protein
METVMKRALAASVVVLSLVSGAAFAASPKVDAAVKTFSSIGSDSAKLAQLCDLFKKMEAVEAEPDDKKAQEMEKQIDAQITSLGADFQAAWDLQAEIDAESADGKAYFAAADELAGKCPTK